MSSEQKNVTTSIYRKVNVLEFKANLTVVNYFEDDTLY